MATLAAIWPTWKSDCSRNLRKRVDIALDAGADGIIYDNNSSSDLNQLLNVYRMIYQYGSSRKKDFLLMGNFHLGTYVFNRLTNCMTTEDGLEPGIYDGAHAHLVRESQYALPIGQGFLVDIVGLFRIHDSLSQGWKPNLIEDGRREYADRLSTPMSPARAGAGAVGGHELWCCRRVVC